NDGVADEDPGGDFMSGGAGQDYMEGNAGVDWMMGDDDNDDMLGGTGRINDDGPLGIDGRLDAGDFMAGGGGYDVMGGDNIVISRKLTDAGAWQLNTFNAGTVHNTRILRDVDSPDKGLVSGGDFMYGNAEDDLLYGQGGRDSMQGNEGDDFMEGNTDGDYMYGDADQDDMIGGTGEAILEDAGDDMYGGDGADVMLGDNGTIDRLLTNGLWQRTSYSPDTRADEGSAEAVTRSVSLFDVATVGTPPLTPNAALSGGDRMFGDAGRDRMWGQGNGAQLPTQQDPTDNVDNDRDGQTDEDGVWLAAGNGWLGDEMHGGDGVDDMEGNAGNDWMLGDAQQDDMIGGSSAGPDAQGKSVIGSNVRPRNVADGHDVMNGGGDDDVLLADNGRIGRDFSGSLWRRQTAAATSVPGPVDTGILASTYGPYDQAVRKTMMEKSPEGSGAWGHDWMRGDGGHDDMYGQLGNDYMEGNAGEDAMVGDLGLIVNRLEDGSRRADIRPQQPFIKDTIFEKDTLSRLVTLYAFTKGGGAEGNDIMLGGLDNDNMHGAAGNDIMNGNAGDDRLFGGDNTSVKGGAGVAGRDVMWGGADHDHLWGGYQDDYLDVNPRATDPAEWKLYGNMDNTASTPGFQGYAGIDYIYGGWDQDALQANLGNPGPVQGDRLMDWVGAYNVYYICSAAYGEYTITRSLAPGLAAFLQQMAGGDGATNTATATSSGFREVGLVFNNEAGKNSNPIHPDNPGHFTCDN
ncbi:MAG: Alkaline phosphatase, partial [uncultured Chloroflexia bacterium]